MSRSGVSRYTIDGARSRVRFSVRHMMITTVRGEFRKVEGGVEYDPARPEATRIQARIEAASIDTRDAKRDEHLRSRDFLDVEQYPYIEFTSKSVRRKRGDRFEIVGDLTVHGVTREVVLDARGPSPEPQDASGAVRVGATATTKLRRSDFGLTWSAVLEAGGMLVSDELSVTLDVSLIEQGGPTTSPSS